ncbi:MAG TPA: septation protein SepH, partial [Mycobacteriales bacterium]|nr:septation protein SepH [Mycobacteriales bacterium]
MRQLHVVGLTDDGGHLLLAARAGAAKGTHRIEVDERLRAALRGSLPPPGHAAAESALSPKEIQARLRGGETPEQVARVAGVPVARVLRYAEPVLAERRRVVDEARAATMIRPRRGASLRPLGDAVDEHLAATAGLRPDTVDWSARRRDDG